MLKQNSIKELDLKYKIYKGYENSVILNKDKEFGNIIISTDFLQEGKDKFNSPLTQYYQDNQHLEKNKDYINLMQVLDHKSKSLYKNYK